MNDETLHNGTMSEGFGLPANYFADSAAAIAARIEWEDEHRALPRLASFGRRSAFTLPAGYFESDPFENIVYPQLSSNRIQHAHGGFEVPPGYFSSEKPASGQLASKREARIISFPWMLRAAAVLAIVAGSVYFLREPSTVTATGDCETIACADREELLRSTFLEVADEEELYELVNPSVLESRLQDPEASQPSGDSANGRPGNKDI
jgi:hypothetical protein